MATSADYGLGEYAFPRGWFMVADAEKLTSTPMNVRFFGKDMVLYRGQSGKAYMVGAYCAHMKTHIGKNTTSFIVREGKHIEGECIRCPYHAWKYGPDGKCVEIPNFDTIPSNAKIDSYTIVERYNAIFFWHDPEGGEPEYELPAIPQWDNPTWVRWHFDDLGVLPIHPIEVVDNISDVQHLQPIHASSPVYFENELRGHKAWQRLGSAGWDLFGEGGPPTDFNTFYTGPGILLSRYSGATDSIMFITHTPVDDGTVRLWHGALVKIADRVPTEEDLATARNLQAISFSGIAQDYEIWANKEACFNPMQLPIDGKFTKVRTWYKQFYNPRAKVSDYLRRSEGVYTIPGIASGPDDEARRAEIMAAG